jgi:F-type H+-transporting ATPase subunit delta
LRTALRNPVIPPEQKSAVMKTLAERIGARPETSRFLETLAGHERFDLLDEIAGAVTRAVDRRAGVVEVEVRSATALDDPLRARLAPVLARLAKARVRTREVVDPALIGGLVLRVGGTVYDGSVASRLEKLKAKLVGGGAGAP